MKKKISESELRNLIKNEVRKIVGEDSLLDPPELGEPHYTAYVDDEYDEDDEYEEEESGWGDVEDEWSPHHNPQVVSIGKSLPPATSPCASGRHSLSEGCGCGSKNKEPDPVDSLVSDILANPKPCPSCGKIHTGSCGGKPCHSCGTMHSGSCGSAAGHKGSYMARPQLTKISEYAEKLLSMIDEGEQIQDWQESKISQMSQMIGDVYHSIEYRKHKGEI